MQKGVAANLSTGKPYGRRAMWEYMRKHGVFTMQNLAQHSDRKVESVREFIKLLLKGGYIEETGYEISPLDRVSKRKQFRLIKNTGHETPRLRLDGSELVTVNDQMWRAMKLIGNFNYFELALAASTDELKVKPEAAKSYCYYLKKSGHLVEVAASSNQDKASYRLVPAMNSGPQAPMVLRTKVVFDPNLGTILWHEEIEP